MSKIRMQLRGPHDSLELTMPNGMALVISMDVIRTTGDDIISVWSDRPLHSVNRDDYPEGRMGFPPNVASWDSEGKIVDVNGDDYESTRSCKIRHKDEDGKWKWGSGA